MNRNNISSAENLIFNIIDQDALEENDDLKSSSARLLAFVKSFSIENDWRSQAQANKNAMNKERMAQEVSDDKGLLVKFNQMISGLLGPEIKGLALGHCRERNQNELTDEEKIKIAKDIEFLTKK